MSDIDMLDNNMTETNTTNPPTQTVEDRLKADGWSLTFKCDDPGTINKESRWTVTIHYNKRTLTIPHRMGCGLRVWRDRISRFAPNVTHWVYDTVRPLWKPGHRVGQLTHERKHPEYEETVTILTKPMDPTIDMVLYCVVSDAMVVSEGQTFDEFCNDMGYSNDSIKTKQIYDACTDEWRQLTRFGVSAAQLFTKYFQDY